MARKQRKSGKTGDQPPRDEAQMDGKLPPRKLPATVDGYDYGRLTPRNAARVKASSRRIQRRVRGTLLGVIGIGRELLAAKNLLPHGQFGPWLFAEFGWHERTARNFMSAAQWLGDKTEIISDLQIAPTAAYLLAAASTPEEARLEALARTQSGERITSEVAHQLIDQVREAQDRAGGENPSGGELSMRLQHSLQLFRNEWTFDRLDDLARQLREFADQVQRRRRSV